MGLLNAGQKYCRMLQGEHSALLSTFIKLPFVIKIFVLSIFERPFYTGLTVLNICEECDDESIRDLGHDNRHLELYSICVWGVMMKASETWAMTTDTLNCTQYV